MAIIGPGMSNTKNKNYTSAYNVVRAIVKTPRDLRGERKKSRLAKIEDQYNVFMTRKKV